MTGFPIYRPRRLRATENLRSLIRETSLSVKDLIFPLFVVPGTNVKKEIETLKNNYQWSVDRVLEAVDEAVELGIPAVLLFGLPSYKDEEGSSAWDDNEPVQRASKAIKAKYPEMVVITDACFCEYTTHGHCGILTADCASVDNDKTLPNLAKLAVSQARCGADIIAPSNMMDGYVTVMRKALDEAGYTNVAIMAYSANSPLPITAPSVPRQIPPPARATAKATRWIRATATKPCGKSRWTLKKARTSSW